MPRSRAAAGSGTATTTAETVAATLPAFSAPSGDVVDLEGLVDITTGTGTTSITVRIRRGTDATGTLIGNAVTATVTAGNRAVVTINATDTLAADSAGVTYVVTVQQTAASGNGTVNSGFITAIY